MNKTTVLVSFWDFKNTFMMKSEILLSLLLYTLLEFFTSASPDGFSLEFEWQQVSSSL